jgi:hypothetical protein
MDASKGNRTLPAAPQAGGAVGAQSPGLTLIASGRDYPTAADLTGAVAVGAPAPQLHTGQPRSSSSVPDSSGTIVANPSDVPAGLARLLDPQARASCLNLATAGDPGVVQLVDYARFASQPALVIVVREVTGHRVYAVGADCGQPGPGADFLAMTVAP